MSGRKRTIVVVFMLLAALGRPSCLAQKVKAGFDKHVDFSTYKTYCMQPPAHDPAMPMLYAHVVGSIEHELSSKGLVRVEKDGDLVLVAIGGTDYGLDLAAVSDCADCKKPLLDPADWPGSTAPPGVAGMPIPKAVVELNFVDPKTDKTVWTGWVEQKLDAEKKSKSFAKAEKAIQKLLKDFPPKKM